MELIINLLTSIRNSTSELITIVLLTFSFLFVSLILISQQLYITVIILSCLLIILIIICKLFNMANNTTRMQILNSFNQHIVLNNNHNNNDDHLQLLNEDNIDSINRGLTTQQIECLPNKILNKELEDRCSICLLKQKINDEIRILPCTHQYHSQCIDQWLYQRSNCPICKTEVNIYAFNINH